MNLLKASQELISNSFLIVTLLREYEFTTTFTSSNMGKKRTKTKVHLGKVSLFPMMTTENYPLLLDRSWPSVGTQ